jgi:hypothetical protein
MVALIGYNVDRSMRKSKKAQQRASQDQAFERLYRTIPNEGVRASGIDDAGMQLPDEQQPPQKKWKKVLKRILIVLAILLALTGIWLGWKFAANIIKVFGWGGIKDISTARNWMVRIKDGLPFYWPVTPRTIRDMGAPN